MITAEQLPSLAGTTLKSTSDEKIGKVTDAYASPDGTHGTFVAVNTARVGSKASMVPIHEATLDGDTLVVPSSKALVKDAPVTQGVDELTPTDEDRLYAHYDLPGDLLEA